MTKQDNSGTNPTGLAYLIGRLDHVLNHRLRDSLAMSGLTLPQYTALSVLDTHVHLSNAQLAERSMVSPQSANEMVKVMEARGWIARQPDPAHGRIIRLFLTEEGKALLQQCNALVAQLEQKMLDSLPADEQQHLHHVLRHLLKTLTTLYD